MSIELVKQLHSPVGGYSCGMQTRKPVAHRHSNQPFNDPPHMMTLRCSRNEGHDGPHQDAYCCYNFQQFEDLDAVPGVRRDRRLCAECSTAWPCKTWSALVEEDS